MVLIIEKKSGHHWIAKRNVLPVAKLQTLPKDMDALLLPTEKKIIVRTKLIYF